MGRAKRNPSPHLALAKAVGVIACITRPIHRVNPKAHHAVVRRIRPVRDARGMAVLHRIEVDVVDMTREVVFVAQRVFPIAPLPDAALALAATTVGYLLDMPRGRVMGFASLYPSYVGRQGAREGGFD